MPRAGVTALRVVEEAEAVVDEVGLPGLTLAAVAARLGVRLPSLYKHVDGMPALQRDLAVRAKTELTQALRTAAVGQAGPDAVVALGQAYRTWAHAHPGRYAATLRAPAPGDDADLAASTAAVQVVLAALSAYGLSGDDAVDAVRALRSALHGFVSLELAGGFGLPVDVDRSFARLLAGVATALTTYRG